MLRKFHFKRGIRPCDHGAAKAFVASVEDQRLSWRDGALGVRELHGSTHPDVLSSLGALYADTISHLRPRVMVQGNPHYLGQPGVVAEIRAILLAAVRSAVLWRQLGGTMWDFVLGRRQRLEAVDDWLP